MKNVTRIAQFIGNFLVLVCIIFEKNDYIILILSKKNNICSCIYAKKLVLLQGEYEKVVYSSVIVDCMDLYEFVQFIHTSM